MWNPVSWNPTLKEGELLAMVVPKYEHSNYVDPLASIPMGGNIVQELGDIVGSLLMLHASESQSQEYLSDPTFPIREGTLLTLVHLVLS